MSSNPGVFISYRRQDSQSAAGRLADHLKEHLRAPVFRDVETIEPGMDFVEAIEKALASCAVMLVVIGPRWVSVTDAAGRRRLDDPNDYTRLEVGTALKRNVRVIPVLVEGAVMPGADELPDELKPLARRNAIELSDKRWNYDVAQLVETVHKVLGDVGLAGSSLERMKQVLSEPERMAEELAKSMGLPAGRKPAPAATKPAGSRRRLWIGAAVALLLVGVMALIDESSKRDVREPAPAAEVMELTGWWRDEMGRGYQIRQAGERVQMEEAGPAGPMVWQGVIMGNQLQLEYVAPGYSMQATLQLAPDGLLRGLVLNRLTGQQMRLALQRQ
jgi:hypothetical protein